METVLDLPNVLTVLYTMERRHIPRITGHADNIFLYETSLKKPRTFGTMKLEAMFHCFQKSNLIFSSWRAIGMVGESGCQA